VLKVFSQDLTLSHNTSVIERQTDRQTDGRQRRHTRPFENLFCPDTIFKIIPV